MQTLPHVREQATASPANEHVLLVMSDGLRWQEVFRGADPRLLTASNNSDNPVDLLVKAYVRPTPEEARAALMPFLWSRMATAGEIYGNQGKGSFASVTNGLNFSYPGYSETLTGHADQRVHSNDNIPNPNVTVLEWLNRQPEIHGRTGAFGAWEIIAGIVNAGRCGFPVNASYAPFTAVPMTPQLALLNRLKAEQPHLWPDEVFDAPTFYTSMEFLRADKPRLFYLSLGETDDWAHAGQYGLYLEAAHRADAYLQQLWDAVQSDPEYRGHTTLLFLTDHGRGSGPQTWRDHGEKIPESKSIFFAAMGAGVPARGELTAKDGTMTQNQVAATVARLLGHDWNAQTPEAGKPITEIYLR